MAMNLVNDLCLPEQKLVIETLYPVLKKYCYSLTRSRSEGDDLAHDVVVKYLARNKGFHENPDALLKCIAKRRFFDMKRRSSIRQEQTTDMSEFSKAPPDIFLEEEIESLVQHLSPLQRTVLILRDVLCYRTEEVASLLNTSSGAVKAALHRARHTMRDTRQSNIHEVSERTPDEVEKEWVMAILQAVGSGSIRTLLHLAGADVIHPLHAFQSVRTMMHGKQGRQECLLCA